MSGFMEHVYHCTSHELKIPDIVDGQGVYLFDAGGRRYMDLESGVWCVAIGHRNERVNRAITQQIGSLMHSGFSYSSRVLEETSTSILKIAGFTDGQCVFLCSGSEAIEISRQVARHLSGNALSMTLHDSYLGAYASVTDRSRGWHLFDWEPCKTCGKSPGCDLLCDALKKIPEGIADFVFEPGSSSGFVRFPPEGLIQNIAGIVRKNGGKVIANEVTTGIGRTGRWFGYHHYGIEPDLIAIGKGIGNGYPVSVALISGALAGELAQKPFRYAQSHQNDPLGAAVAGAVVKSIREEGLIAEAERKGSLFLSWLSSLVDHEIILGVRGRGLMFALDLVDAKLADRVHDDLIEQGYIIGNRGTTFRIDPPITITEGEFEGFVEAFRGVLSAYRKNR